MNSLELFLAFYNSLPQEEQVFYRIVDGYIPGTTLVALLKDKRAFEMVFKETSGLFLYSITECDVCAVEGRP